MTATLERARPGTEPPERAPAKKALLEAEGLTARYGATKVLHGISLRIEQGSLTALLGANGAGKTTLLRALCSMVATEGQIRLDGRRIDGLATEEIVRLGVAHVPQGRGNFNGLTVEENLKLGALAARGGARAGGFEQVFGYFPVLAGRLGQQAGTLSGGEQQMLAVARALMLRPRLLLLDEPSLGLAPRVTAELFKMLGRINREQGMTILLAEQNAAVALTLADQVLLLETGRMAISCPAGELAAKESLRRSYLGY